MAISLQPWLPIMPGLPLPQSGAAYPDQTRTFFLEVIRFSQTSDYIRSIYEIYSMYRTLYGEIP